MGWQVGRILPLPPRGWSRGLLILGLSGLLAGGTGAASPQDATKPKAPEKPQRGLILNESKAYQGYTLLAPIMSSKTFLLDMQGRVVRTWQGDSATALTTRLLENGNLLRYAKLSQQTFGDGAGAGGHIQEFSWDGQLLWDFKLASSQQLGHHDILKLPNGNVLAILWEKKTQEEAIAAGRRPETVAKGGLLPDAIVEIKPTGKTTGKIVWEWHAWDHIIQDHDSSKANFGEVGAHPERIDLNFGEGTLASIVAKKEELEKLRAIGYIGTATPGGQPAPARVDWLHSNGLAYNEDLDQIMISVHEFSEIWVIDHSTTTAEAASHKGGRSGKGGDLLYRYGNPRAYRAGTRKDQQLFHQHNAHWIPKGHPGEGHVLVFNNGLRRTGGAYSSVDELVLPADKDGRYHLTTGKAYGPDKPAWSYSAPKRIDFMADFISGAHRLPNGNTFICAGPSGTIFEVTPQKEMVWRYLNPVRPDSPPGTAGPARMVEVVPEVLRDAIHPSAAQLAQWDDLRSSGEKKIAALLSDEQKKALEALATPTMPPGALSLVGIPPTVQVLSPMIRPRLKLSDDQKKQVDTLQTETTALVEKSLTDAQKKTIKEIRDRFINAWGGGPPPAAPPGKPDKPGTAAKPNKPATPVPGGGPPNLSIAVFRCYRYGADFPGLAGKDLTPGKTVEELQGQKP